MLIQGHQLGVQSWTFRTYQTIPDLLAAVQACGLDAVELCGVHVDVTDPVAVETALAQFRAAGITLTSFGIAGFPNDEEKVRPLFQFAKAAGIPALGADPDPDALPLLDRLCDEYGVRLAVHNHGRHHRYGSIAQLDELFRATSPNIGLCMDTAWMLDAGENPIAAAQHFAARLYGVHLKDFIFRDDGTPEDVVIGTGELKLPALLATLRAVGFQGYLTLEYEGDEHAPIPSVQACLEALRPLA